MSIPADVPPPQIVAPKPFHRTNFGVEVTSLPAGRTLREFVAVKEPWGCTLQLERKDGNAWAVLHAERLTPTATAGAWFELGSVEESADIAYRYRIPADGARPEVLSAEAVIRHRNPRDYTGLAAEAYALIQPHQPHTVIDVVEEMPQGTAGGAHALATAMLGYDLITLHSSLAEGGANRRDFRTVVLHEAAHLRQYEVYGDAAAMGDEIKGVYGNEQFLEKAANCLMERWGGLAEGNHFPYCDTPEAIAMTDALAAGRPYFRPGSPHAPTA
ncbi:MAG: hypothetical protein LWW86_05690 [Micrococcales bacterium]|nr:hypothetical protein [Micrococcales bacterium]